MSPSQSHAERRRFQRILLDAPAILRTSGKQFSSKLVDISLNGALVQRPPNWPAAVSGPVTIGIELDEHQTQIQMQARIVHVKTDCLGFRCEHIDMSGITHLRRLVELNMNDPDLLERQLEALMR